MMRRSRTTSVIWRPHTRIRRKRFRFAWGGAGWALSKPAAELTEQHLDFYDFLVETTGCPAQTCNANMSWPAHHNHDGRGLRLNNAYADDVVFGLFMSALNVEAKGPAGFQQTPLDILAARPRAHQRNGGGFDEGTTCVSGATGRVHALGGFFDDNLAQTASAVATSSCRGAQRPASIHLGEETGGPLNKLWRAQLPQLTEAFRGRVLASVPRGSPFHYGRLCVVEGAPIEPTELVEMPAPLPLPFESGGVQDSTQWARATQPDQVARRACGALGRDDDACVDQLRAMAMRIKDALWNHRRPVSAEVTLGDGSTTTVVVEAGEDPTASWPRRVGSTTSPPRLCHAEGPADARSKWECDVKRIKLQYTMRGAPEAPVVDGAPARNRVPAVVA